MFERFSREAKRAVSQAGEEAQRLGHRHIGTEHLLLGLLAVSGTAASDALVAAGASLVPAREKVVEALASRTPSTAAGAGGDLPFTDRAARTLDRSGRLSLRMGSEEVRGEHILLSVLDVEGTAGQVLRGLGVDPEAVRRALTAQATEHEQATEPERYGEPEPLTEAHPGVPGPLCASCGSSLSRSLERMTLPVGAGPSAPQVDVYYCTVCGTAIGAAPR